MLLDALRENPTFVALEAKKQEKDRLEAEYDKVTQSVQEEGTKLYQKLEELVLKEIRKRRENYLSQDTKGIELAKKLCEHGIHPWAKRTKYTAVYTSRGDKYFHKNHKRIPKYYIEHCPICGEVLCTQKRVYRFGKREIVDISLEEFEENAAIFGYYRGALEIYTESLPRISASSGKVNMIDVLHTLKDGQPTEIGAIIQSILDYWEGNDSKSYEKSDEYQHALKNAEELCTIFGHDVRTLDSRCKCCGKRINRESLLSDYHNATMSGVVDFPYLHDNILLLDTDETEDAGSIFLCL